MRSVGAYDPRGAAVEIPRHSMGSPARCGHDRTPLARDRRRQNRLIIGDTRAHRQRRNGFGGEREAIGEIVAIPAAALPPHLSNRCFPTCPSHRNRSRSTAGNHFTVLSIGGLAGALSRSHFDGLSLNSYDTGDGQRRRIADRQGHGRQVVTALCLTPGWLGFDLHVGCFFSKIYSPYGL